MSSKKLEVIKRIITTEAGVLLLVDTLGLSKLVVGIDKDGKCSRSVFSKNVILTSVEPSPLSIYNLFRDIAWSLPSKTKGLKFYLDDVTLLSVWEF